MSVGWLVFRQIDLPSPRERLLPQYSWEIYDLKSIPETSPSLVSVSLVGSWGSR